MSIPISDIHDAIRHNRIETIRQYLTQQIDVNPYIETENSDTLLHTAVA